MAKEFNQVYKKVKETVYSSKSNALTVLATMNSAAEFSPILAPNGASTGTSKYNLQRMKRFSVNDVADPNQGTVTAALAALDQWVKEDWETQEVVTGILRSVGVAKTLNDDNDAGTDFSIHEGDIMRKTGEVAAQRHKDLIALLQTGAASGAALPAYAAGDSIVWDAIADEVDKLAKVEDEFKDITEASDYVILISREVAKELTKEMGQAFNQEAPIAQTGFTSAMQINGTPVLVDSRLTGREPIIFHKEALAFKSEEIRKDFAIDLGITAKEGTFFYDVMAIVDPARIAVIKA